MDLLHAVNQRQGTQGFTALPKEGALRIKTRKKIRRLRPGLNPRTWVPKASALTPRPPKPLSNVTSALIYSSVELLWIYPTILSKIVSAVIYSSVEQLWIYPNFSGSRLKWNWKWAQEWQKNLKEIFYTKIKLLSMFMKYICLVVVCISNQPRVIYVKNTTT
jgi:hypothetical protein